MRRRILSAQVGALLAFVNAIAASDAYAIDPIANWERLLDAWDPIVQTEWAFWYENATDIGDNFERAVRLYCAAARQGHAPAQMRLGWLYANGVGVERNPALAGAWLRLVAANGDIHARRFLALLNNPPRVRPTCVPPQAVTSNLGTPRVKSPERERIEGWVHRDAPRYGLDPRLVLAVIQTESGFNANARSPANALGLMQLIPETAQRFGVLDVYNPQQNLHGGMAYLQWLLAHFGGNLRHALAAYNAGEDAVSKYQGIPPYSETQSYVRKVINAYGQSNHPPIPQGVIGAIGFIGISTPEDVSKAN